MVFLFCEFATILFDLDTDLHFMVLQPNQLGPRPPQRDYLQELKRQHKPEDSNHREKKEEMLRRLQEEAEKLEREVSTIGMNVEAVLNE